MIKSPNKQRADGGSLNVRAAINVLATILHVLARIRRKVCSRAPYILRIALGAILSTVISGRLECFRTMLD